MAVKIYQSAFDPWLELQSYQAACLANSNFGATAVFVGTMRDFNDQDAVTHMTLEHYPGMAEKQLEHIVGEAKQQWPILDALVVHRVGELLPQQPIVLVAVWNHHRGNAFDACRYIIEALKTNAPFWKKETLTGGQIRWVAKNTDGYNQNPA